MARTTHLSTNRAKPCTEGVYQLPPDATTPTRQAGMGRARPLVLDRADRFHPGVGPSALAAYTPALRARVTDPARRWPGGFASSPPSPRQPPTPGSPSPTPSTPTCGGVPSPPSMRAVTRPGTQCGPLRHTPSTPAATPASREPPRRCSSTSPDRASRCRLPLPTPPRSCPATIRAAPSGRRLPATSSTPVCGSVCLPNVRRGWRHSRPPGRRL